jgi:hypothetical protein
MEDSKMRATLVIGAFALFSLTAPASAQMCGGGQQTQNSSSAKGGMMCGAAKEADDPMADKSTAPKAQRMGGMCACCGKMAMMGGGKGDDPHKGMDVPR